MNINTGKVSARARVKFEVEIEVGSTWGADCSIAQVHQQAFEEASNFLGQLCMDEKVRGRMKMLGNPAITAVLVEKKP